MWSSSGSQRTPFPSFHRDVLPSPGLERKDAPLCHYAPDSSPFGAVSKKKSSILDLFFPLFFVLLFCPKQVGKAAGIPLPTVCVNNC